MSRWLDNIVATRECCWGGQGPTARVSHGSEVLTPNRPIQCILYTGRTPVKLALHPLDHRCGCSGCSGCLPATSTLCKRLNQRRASKSQAVHRWAPPESRTRAARGPQQMRQRFRRSCPGRQTPAPAAHSHRTARAPRATASR